MSKADYVRDAIATDDGAHKHHCHWPGCTETVTPAAWGCRKHWYKLPADLRSAIWKAYRPGQEQTKTPSPEYVGVARRVQEWIAANDKPWWEKEGLAAPCPNWDGEARRCNCRFCRERRRDNAAQPSFGFDDDHSVGTSRSSVKRSHRAEGRNFID